jgi:hypothetical protein
MKLPLSFDGLKEQVLLAKSQVSYDVSADGGSSGVINGVAASSSVLIACEV